MIFFKSVVKIHSINNEVVPPEGPLGGIPSPSQYPQQLSVVCVLHHKVFSGVEFPLPVITSLILPIFGKVEQKTFVQQPQNGIINQ